ncbi:MAG TPA: hypothetical protein VIZ69_00585 [Thermoanaerobaculia bacterium]
MFRSGGVWHEECLGIRAMSPFGTGLRTHRMAILFLVLMLVALALEAWGIHASLENLF